MTYSKKKISLSVVIPCYNEEGNLALCIRNLVPILHNHTHDFEIIIVDDGSTDNTASVASKLNDESNKIKLIMNQSNLGIGGCYQKALEIAEMDFICWLPSDLEIMPHELIPSLGKLFQYDCIVTYPINSKEVRPYLRYKISLYYQYLLQRLFNMDIHYFNGVTFFNTNLIKKISFSSTRFTFTAESVIKFLKFNKQVNFIQLPIHLSHRNSGKTKAFRLKSIINVFYSLVKLRMTI